MISIYFK